MWNGNNSFLPISVWKIGQQSIGVVVVGVGETLDREKSFSLFLASNGEKIFFLYSKSNQIMFIVKLNLFKTNYAM